MTASVKQLSILILAAVLGLAAFICLRSQAFPDANIDFQITSEEAQKIAGGYVVSRGHDLGGYAGGTVLDGLYDQHVFLQRVWGIERYNEELEKNDGLDPWYYSTRFYIPLEKEEFGVGVDGRGEVVWFDHIIPDEAAGENVSVDEARQIALAFAAEELGVDTAAYEQSSYQEHKMPNRTDHAFSFDHKERGIEWTDESKATERFDVLVQGGEIGYFSAPYLHVPESFIRDQQIVMASGDLYLMLAMLAEGVLLAAAAVMAAKGYKAGDLRPRYVFWFAGAMLAASAIDLCLAQAGSIFYYDTSVPWSNFVLGSVLDSLVWIGWIVGGSVLLAGIAGERLARQAFPAANDLDGERAPGRRRLWVSTLYGVLFAGVLIGLQTVFYFFATSNFGVWSPVAPNFAYFAGALPFLLPIIWSLTAAVSEEFAYRLFGVSFAKRLFGGTFLALLVPAVVWAFLHSGYEVYPMYVRGVELTLLGIVFGWIYVRYGILTAIAAHYVLDAIHFSMPLLTSANWYWQASGVLAIAAVGLIPEFVHQAARFYERRERAKETVPAQALAE